jgi:DUF1365 family protein
VSPARESAIYSGRVWHRRRGQPAHAFSYRVTMLYLDLAELPTLLAPGGAGPAPFRAGRLGVLSFDRHDYLAGPASLADAARDRVQAALGFRPAGPVRLLTHVRSLGYVFNPVTFYYLFAADGRTLEAVVAEITSTPWKERHAYVIRAGPEGVQGDFDKAFHVSPFFPMAQRYRWALTVPGAALLVTMANEQAGAEVFSARLALERRPWSTASLWRAALLDPLMPWRVHAAIYWEALRLWWKRAPFFVHPTQPPEGPAHRPAQRS